MILSLPVSIEDITMHTDESVHRVRLVEEQPWLGAPSSRHLWAHKLTNTLPWCFNKGSTTQTQVIASLPLQTN